MSCAASASGQQASTFLPPALPYNYNQDRNVSISEVPRPDYAPLGARLGGFMLYPRLDIAMGGSNNVYLRPAAREGDMFAELSPSVEVRSDWNRHMVRIAGSGSHRRYFREASLNTDIWTFAANGRADIGDYGNLTVETRLSQQREEPFTAQIDAADALLSRYRQSYFAARAERQMGNGRLTLSIDRTGYRFRDILSTVGTSVSQADRDRHLTTLAGQGEYSLTPGAVVFAQLAYTDTDYEHDYLTSGAPNRGSGSWRFLAGMNFDLQGVLRGTVGLGYLNRNFDAAVYRSVGGLTIETEITYFLSRLTNLNLRARRVMEDSAVADGSSYRSTILSVGADTELRANILAGMTAGYGAQDYVDLPLTSESVQMSAYARYLMSRRVSIRLQASYGSRVQRGGVARSNIKESGAMMTLEIHP